MAQALAHRFLALGQIAFGKQVATHVFQPEESQPDLVSGVAEAVVTDSPDSPAADNGHGCANNRGHGVAQNLGVMPRGGEKQRHIARSIPPGPLHGFQGGLPSGRRRIGMIRITNAHTHNSLRNR